MRPFLKFSDEFKSLARKFFYEYNEKDNPSSPINYIGISEDDGTKLSYLDAKRIERIQNEGGDFYDAKLRYHGRPGKVLRKIWPDMPNGIIEKVSAHLRCNEDIDNSIEIVTGDAIKQAYHYQHYAPSNSSNLWNSCMRYDQCQNWFGIYTDNSQVSLIVARNAERQVTGRAILWNDTYLDRIYAYDECVKQKIIQYAENKKYKSIYDRYENLEYVSELTIKLDQSDFDYYPYLDTMRYLTGRELSMNDSYCDYILDSTEGGPNEENHEHQRYSEYHGEWIDEDEASYCERSDDYFYYDEIVEIDGEYVWSNHDDVCEDIDREYRFKDDCVYSEFHSEWIHSDEASYCELNEDYYKADEVVFCEVEEMYVFEDDAHWSDYHNTYISIDNAIEIDGDFYHKSHDAELIENLENALAA